MRMGIMMTISSKKWKEKTKENVHIGFDIQDISDAVAA